GASAHWQVAAETTSTHLGPLFVRQIGGLEGAGDVDGVFLETFSLRPGGAVLVRPDGFVAWVCREHPDSPTEALQAALSQIFSAPHP
ncbi:MAG: hypothetical protein ACOVMP_11185, partial [Chthoniobacterales bacterium]